MPPLVASMTVSRFEGRAAPRGLLKMGLDPARLAGTPGLRFFRLLGTARGGSLSLSADLRRWARFAVWDSRAALDLFEASPWRRAELALAAESYTVVLRPVRWHGAWGGSSPFGEAAFADAPPGPVAALTRGTIRPSRLVAFWRAAPASQVGLFENPGLLKSLGVGETPLTHQGTFTLWRDAAALRAFAYRGEAHRAAIRRTREVGWYAEELFARFSPEAAWGEWDGGDPLEGLL